MSIEKAKTVLGEVADGLTDAQIEQLIALYRAIARVFIQKHCSDKLENSPE